MIAAIHASSVAGASLLSNASTTAASGNHVDSATAGASPFSDLMAEAIGKVGQLEDQARSAVQGLITGGGVDVHQAMIASEKASMAFELALAVRNKAIQSYQSVMGMQF